MTHTRVYCHDGSVGAQGSDRGKRLGSISISTLGTRAPTFLGDHGAKKDGWNGTARRKMKRVLIVTITEVGDKLKEKAVCVPEQMAGCIHLEKEEAIQLYQLLYKILGKILRRK
ncbi:MAG: hypothetical protein ACLR6I_07430 [Waltera sp.]